MGSAVRTFAGVLFALLVGGLVAAGLATWRMSRGPIRLDALTTRLERLLAAPDGSMTVDVGSTALEWDSETRALDIRVRDLRVLGPGGTPRATIPALSVGIASGALLLGTVAPRTLEAVGLRIHVTREPDGRLETGVGQEPDTEATRLLVGALVGGEPRGGLASVRRLGIRDGEIILDDRASGVTWHATGVSFAARRDGGGIAIERLAFDLAPASVVATGHIRGGGVDLDVALTRIPTALLERWWPAGVAPPVRRWVLGNVSGGGVTAARATVSGALTDAGSPRVTLGSVQGRVTFGGLAVRWRDGMPPFTGVGGTGSFSSAGWTLRVARGGVEGLEVVRALASPAPAGADAIRVDAVVRSPLSKALALLARPGMRAVANFPLRPGEISGGATAHVLVQVPLDDGAVGVQASGDLRSVSLRRAFRGRNVNSRRLRFDLDERAFEMRGEITVGRAPLQLRWREALSGTARGQRLITVKGRLDAEERKAFGADFDTWLTGPIDVQARLAPKGQVGTAMQVDLDLTPASIDLPLINLVKPAGAPGSSDARLVLANGQVTAIDDFRLLAAGTSVGGRAVLGPRETWKSAEGTITMPPRADGGAPGHITVALKPAGTSHQLTVTSDDAGAVFRAVDTFADASGGHMKLVSSIRLGVPGLPLTGTLSADQFILKRSPMIAKIAALGGIGGVIDLLAADGLPFSQLAVTFTQRAAVITISEGVAASPGLAMTTRGTVDRVRDELSLDGTLVPNYAGLARLTKDLPEPGSPLDGIDGKRADALEFSVGGSLADPYVTAKPATGISPSALRDLLRLTTTRVDLSRPAKRRDAASAEELEEELPGGRKKKARGRPSRSGTRAKPGASTGAGAKPESAAKPRVKRKAPAGPAARDTDTE